MSLPALLEEVRDYLREQNDYLPQECDVMPRGQPPPKSGQRYVAVHPEDWSPADQDINNALSETFSLAVTVTIRSPYVPEDRKAGKLWLESLYGIDKILREIIATIVNGRQTIHVNCNANSRMGSNAEGFLEPLRWQGCDPEPRTVGPDWFYSTGTKDVGLTQTARFGGATRIQTFSNLE